MASSRSAGGDDPLAAALGVSQRLGMLGRGPIDEVIHHSESFLAPLSAVFGTVVDLGSGGGVPGLVIAWRRPDLRLILVDRRATRTDHLRRLARRLELTDRVEVITAEASALPRRLEQPADAVVARGFGPPQALLQAADPVLAAGGILVVSEPPAGTNSGRWPERVLDDTAFRRRPWSDPRVAVFDHVPRESKRDHVSRES